MRIVCVGGGPAGLYAALLLKLHDPGHDITVFERDLATSAPGWGVTFGGDLMRRLYECDPPSARQIDQAAFRWTGQMVDVEGKQVQHATGDGYSIERLRLLDILARRAQSLGVRLEAGREVTCLSQLPEAGLIVAADGVNSRIRGQVGGFGTHESLSANRYLWLGTTKAFGSFGYYFVHTNCGWVWAYAYGIDDKSSTFIVECSPETWSGLGFDTMPPEDSLSLLEKFFERHLDSHRLIGQARNGANVQWLNFRTVTNQRWYDKNVVLAGDAAHTTHYSIGWGTKLAIEDAMALAENVRDRDRLPQALQSYEEQRQAALRQPQSEARYSARWFEDLSRYIGLEPRQFSALLHGRRSPLVSHIPPKRYYQLLWASEEVPVLRQLRSSVGPKAKAVLSRRRSSTTGR
jgi:2-polyprenyl-6-methoxyphenol hydroxylase-like FAD-dependent oxidoreductase